MVKKRNRYEIYTPEERLPTDIMANQYACEILMPVNAFRRALQRHQGDILKIGEQFGVSVLAVKLRYDTLIKFGR